LVFDTGRLPNAIVLEREMEYRLVLQTEIVETVVWNAWAVIAVLLGAGVWGVASAQIARALVGYVLLGLRGPHGFIAPILSWSRVRPLLKFGAKFQAFSAITLLRDQGLSVAIAAVGGLTAIGVWTIVYRLTLVVGVLLESLWRVSYPAMSRLKEVGRAPGPVIQRAVSMATIMVGLLVVPLGGSAPALIPVLFGDAWRGAINVIPLAAAAVLITGPLTSILVGYLMAQDRAGLLMRMSVIDGVTLSVVGLPLLSLIGVTGLGIGAVAAALADMLILSRELHRGWSIGVLGQMLAPAVASGVAGVSTWLVASALGANLGSLVTSIVAGEAIYIAVLFALGRQAFLDSARIARRVQRRFAHAM
jgi:O-antigen/teichoic acid export membrane protein